MKKLPKHIKQLLKEIQKNNSCAYVEGISLCKLFLDKECDCWNIVTDCKKEILDKILQNGKFDSKNMIYIDQISDSENTKKQDTVSIRILEDGIANDLDQKFISIDSVLYDGTDLRDPYESAEDIEAERIRLLYDPFEYLREYPEDVMEILLRTAQTGFDVSKKTKQAITKTAPALKESDKRKLTLAFQDIMVQEHTGKALKVMDETGLLAVLVGEKLYRRRNKKEIAAFKKYMDNIDNTLPILDRRIVSFYLGFWKKNDMKAMNALDYDQELKDKLAATHDHLSDLYYMNNTVAFKDYLYKYGLKMYTFMDKISKIQAKVYGLDTTSIRRRHGMLTKVARDNEPVFLEDLSMNAETLIQEGLAKDQKEAEALLDLLVYVVHRHPDLNEPHLLLSQAYRMNKNFLKRARYMLCGKRL